METVRIVLLGLVVVLFLAFVAVTFAYIQFVITETGNKMDKVDTLIEKVSNQNTKIDTLIRNKEIQPVQINIQQPPAK